MAKVRYWSIALIVGSCLAVYGVTLAGEFLAWDDRQHFFLNPHLVAGEFQFFWTNAYYGFFAPVTYTVWTTLFQISHEPWPFHLLNLILHTCNALFVFSLIKALLKTDDRTAALGALVFALHPLQVEPVAWISGGRDLMAAFFGLAAMRTLLIGCPEVQMAGGLALNGRSLSVQSSEDSTLSVQSSNTQTLSVQSAIEQTLYNQSSDIPTLYKQSSETPTLYKQSPKIPTLYKQIPLFATVLFILGLLAKPSLAALPFALFAFDVCRGRTAFRRRTLSLWCTLSAGLLAYTLTLQAPYSDPRLTATFFERALVAIDAAGFYLKSFLWPWPLSFSYDRQIAEVLSEKSYLRAAVFLFLGAPVLVLLAWRFGKIVPASLAFAVVLLLSTLGFVPFAGQVQSTAFDRYMYLTLAAAALVTATVVRGKASRFACIVLISVMAALSFSRARDWLNDRNLNESAIAINPRNYIALNNLAIYEISQKQFKTAEIYLRRAWVARPKHALAPANLAHALWLQNDVGSVLKEILPLTGDEHFLTYNAREPESLALIFRMTARALTATLDHDGARKNYLKALHYGASDAGLQSEYGLYLRENQ